MSQADLFGEPERDAVLSQWHTPRWLALKLAGWVPRSHRVLEPCCGGGALIDGLLRAGHPAGEIRAIEVDCLWAAHCEGAFPGVRVLRGDFLSRELQADIADVVVMNPPFERNLHMRFVLRALELAPMVVGIFPVWFEFSGRRDRELWATHGVVTRRARMPERVNYGGSQSPSFDSVALQIERRWAPRAVDEQVNVMEEVWIP